MLKVAPGEKIHWTFGDAGGDVEADATGCVTVAGLKIIVKPVTLKIAKIQ